jgi:hypothetical protein
MNKFLSISVISGLLIFTSFTSHQVEAKDNNVSSVAEQSALHQQAKSMIEQSRIELNNNLLNPIRSTAGELTLLPKLTVDNQALLTNAIDNKLALNTIKLTTE